MERQFALRHQSGIGTTHCLTRGRVDAEDHKFTGVAMNHNSVQAAPLGVASHFAINYPLIANNDASSQSSAHGACLQSHWIFDFLFICGVRTVSAALRFGRGNLTPALRVRAVVLAGQVDDFCHHAPRCSRICSQIAQGAWTLYTPLTARHGSAPTQESVPQIMRSPTPRLSVN
jgi:hypothetical protein